MLLLVVPRLISFIQALSESELRRFPGLAMMYSRSRHESCPAEGVEDLVCRHYGISRQADWPLAAITYEFDGGRAGSDFWLRADPVHVQIHRDKLVLTDDLDLSADDAQTLCNALASHFGDSFNPLPVQPTRWYLRVSSDPEIATTPLSQALGQPIDDLLPKGQGALKWRKLLNEAQMLLFHHPLNLERESRHATTINSVWLWGGGTFPAPPTPESRTAFYGTDFTARAIAKYAQASAHPLPDGWHREIGSQSLCLFDQLNRSLLHRDMTACEAALGQLETGWIGPLMRAGETFEVNDPVQGVRLTWHPSDRWKFWRRSKTAARSRFDMAISPPRQPAGVDEFGNRY